MCPCQVLVVKPLQIELPGGIHLAASCWGIVDGNGGGGPGGPEPPLPLLGADAEGAAALLCSLRSLIEAMNCSLL